MRKTLIAVVVLISPLLAQTTKQDTGATNPLPADVVYQAFFGHVVALENAAAEHDKNGRKGSEVRAYYQQAVKLTNREATDLKRIADACGGAVHALDVRAQKIIEAAWASHPDRKLPIGAKAPAPPPELAKLDLERIDTVNAHMQKLRDALGPDSFRKLDGYVQNNFARQIQVVPVVPPGARTPRP